MINEPYFLIIKDVMFIKNLPKICCPSHPCMPLYFPLVQDKIDILCCQKGGFSSAVESIVDKTNHL